MMKTDLGEIIYSLSKALDTSANGIAFHHHTVALISIAIAEKLSLGERDQNLIFLSALVHDAGVVTDHEITELLSFEDKNPFEHCTKGYDIFCKSSYMREIAKILLHHHDRWQGESISGLRGGEVPLSSNIIYLADRVAVLVESGEDYILNRSKGIIRQIAKNSGSSFNPLVVDAFLEASKSESFWLDLQPQMIFDLVSLKKPKIPIHITPEDLTDIAVAYSKIIDIKSRYTYNHSNAVAQVAEFLADKFSFSEHEKIMIKVAGYLHDLGKLSIPNELLDKPSRLTPEEYLIIQRHTYYSYRLIQAIPGFEAIAAWGAYHHERLNGSGYPFKLKGKHIPLGAKIMAVSDIFTALTEDRPYRKGLTREECLKILKSASDREHIDENIVNFVELYYNNLLSLTKRTLD